MKYVKRIGLYSLRIVVILLIGFWVAEQAMLWRIRTALERTYADDYAILRLHMGGKPYASPSLARMLPVIVDYNMPGHYPPEGSGGYTGKFHYLTFLVSDNEKLCAWHWSFRRFALVCDSWSAPWSVIANLPETSARVYTYHDNERIRRRGLWYAGPQFNDPSIHFYYRIMRPELQHLKLELL